MEKTFSDLVKERIEALLSSTTVELVNMWEDDHEMCCAFKVEGNDQEFQYWWSGCSFIGSVMYFNHCEKAREDMKAKLNQYFGNQDILNAIELTDGEPDYNFFRGIGFSHEELETYRNQLA